MTLSTGVKFTRYDELTTRSSWRIFCDGYHRLCFPFLYLLHPSVNPGMVKGWGQADLNTLWTVISLFLIYVKSMVTRIAGIKLFITPIIAKQTRQNVEQTILWIPSLLVVLNIPSHLSFTVQNLREGQGAPGKSITTFRCGATVLKVRPCACCRHRHVINSTRSFGFIASI